MRKKRKSEDSGFNVWRSYSDMMAGVLLLFVLLMCVTLFQAQKSYNDAMAEQEAKIKLQEEYTAKLLAQQTELDAQGLLLDEQDKELESKEMLLAQMAKELEEKEALLLAQQDLVNATSTIAAQVAAAVENYFKGETESTSTSKLASTVESESASALARQFNVHKDTVAWSCRHDGVFQGKFKCKYV